MRAISFNGTNLECIKHKPGEPTGEGMALTHGAGGDRDSALLIAIAEAFSRAGVLVLRFNLAYRQLRPKGPPSPAGAARDRDSIRVALGLLREEVEGPVYLAGQSYGGRQVSMLAAEDPSIASVLALFSYPLIAPNGNVRTEHFPRIEIPTLFVHGGGDPFATSEQLEQARQAIPARTVVNEVPKGGHGLKAGRFPMDEVIAGVRELAAHSPS